MSFDYVFDYGTNIHIISLEQTLSSLKVINNNSFTTPIGRKTLVY
jgi:hypothetical protein